MTAEATAGALTPCCSRTPLELPRSEHLTADARAATCSSPVWIIALTFREALTVAEQRELTDNEWQFLRDATQLRSATNVRAIFTEGAARRPDANQLQITTAVLQAQGQLRYV